MIVRMQQRRGPAATWTAANPILGAGEMGYDETNKIVKIGDGATPWNSLVSFQNFTVGTRRGSLGVRNANYAITVPGNTGSVGNGEFQLCDASAGAFTISLPAVTALGQVFSFRKIDNTNNVVTISGVDIDGKTEYRLEKPGDYITLVAGNAAGLWRSISSSAGVKAVRDLALFKDVGRDDKRFILSTDAPVLTMNAAAGPEYNRLYSRGADTYNPPADWPVDNGHTSMFSGGSSEQQLLPMGYDNRLLRFWHDGDGVAFYTYGTQGQMFHVYVDGHPISAAPGLFAATGFALQTLEWATKRPRLIEIVTAASLHTLFVKAPYRLWKPQPLTGPLVYVIGDSYVAGLPIEDDGSGWSQNKMGGIYQDMARWIGVGDIILDGQGGTGFLQTFGGMENYRTRLAAIDATKYQPDVLVFHGGGANDLLNGKTTAQIITQAIATLVEARVKYPNAKLVFLDGITPPAFPYATQYLTIRNGVMADAGVQKAGVYFVNLLEPVPVIRGAGNVVTPNADALNANVYIGDDNAHYVAAGGVYMRSVIAPKLVRIMRDTLNTLVNTVI